MASFKYAVVINGNPDKCYLDHVTSALSTLKAEGFETFVVSPVRPDVACDNFLGTFGPKMDDVQKLTDLLNNTMDGDDELVIYTTGRGTIEKSIPKICLKDACDFENFVKLLGGIKHGQRTVVMEQNYGGLWRNVFTDKSSTRFFAVSTEDEPDCTQFGTGFWAKDVPDRDGDGVINWEERYANGMAKLYEVKLEKARQIGKIYARVQALNSVALGQAEAGLEAEAATTIGESVSNAVTMDNSLIKAEAFGLIAETVADAVLPEEMAVALFKRLWNESKEFKDDEEAYVPALSSLAAATAKAGQKDRSTHIFGNAILIAANTRDDESKKAGYLKTIADSIARSKIEILEALRLLDRIARQGEKIEDPSLRTDVFSATALALTKKDQKDKAAEYYEKALVATRQISNKKIQTSARREISRSLAEAGFREKAWEVLEPILLKDGQIADLKERALSLKSDAFLMADMGFLEKALDTFENALKAAEGIEDPAQSFDAAKDTAFAMSVAGFKREAAVVYGALISKSDAETDAQSRSRDIQSLVSSVALAKLGGELTAPLFEKILPAAAGITDEVFRSQALLLSASNIAKSDMDKFRAAELLKLTAAYIDRFEDNDVRRRIVKEIEAVFEKAGILDYYSGEYELAILNAAKIKNMAEKVKKIREIAYEVSLSDRIGNSTKYVLLNKLCAVAEAIEDDSFRTKALSEIEVLLTTASLALYLDGSKVKAQDLMDRLVRAVKTLKNRDRELKRHIIPFMQALCLKMDGI